MLFFIKWKMKILTVSCTKGDIDLLNVILGVGVTFGLLSLNLYFRIVSTGLFTLDMTVQLLQRPFVQ